MNRLGMLVDISHVSERAMFDAMEASDAPILFSHSNARAVYNVVRNVPDAVLRRLPDQGGVVMVNSYLPLVADQEREANITIKDVVGRV